MKHSYDAANRIKTLTNANSEVTSWSYDDAGRLTRQDLANLTKATYTYDNADRLTGLTNSKSDDTVISSFAYTYYDAGGKKTVTESGGAITTYTYDEADRLTREQRTVANAYDYQYTYDYVGNRLTMVDGGTSTTTYSYDVANQLTVKVASDLSRTTYSYDNNGNLTQANASGSVTTYTWGYENHMLTDTLPSSAVTTFTYDGDGLRRQSQTVGGTTKFILDGQDVLLETDSGGTTQVVYTQTPDMYGNTISQRRGATSAFYHYDALGSTSELTDASQAVTDTNRYYAFGGNLTSPGPTTNPYGFVGKQGYYTEPALGLQYLRARWYDPSLGRFVSEDPLGIDGGDTDLYVYVKDDPTNATDPGGRAGTYVRVRDFDQRPSNIRGTGWWAKKKWGSDASKLSKLDWVYWKARKVQDTIGFSTTWVLYPNAVSSFLNYMNNTPSEQWLDVPKLLREVPSAKRAYNRERDAAVAQVKRDYPRKPGQYYYQRSSATSDGELVVNASENRNWNLAIQNYRGYGEVEVYVNCGLGGLYGNIWWRWYVVDPYVWESHNRGEFGYYHAIGIAREYLQVGGQSEQAGEVDRVACVVTPKPRKGCYYLPNPLKYPAAVGMGGPAYAWVCWGDPKPCDGCKQDTTRACGPPGTICLAVVKNYKIWVCPDDGKTCARCSSCSLPSTPAVPVVGVTDQPAESSQPTTPVVQPVPVVPPEVAPVVQPLPSPGGGGLTPGVIVKPVQPVTPRPAPRKPVKPTPAVGPIYRNRLYNGWWQDRDYHREYYGFVGMGPGGRYGGVLAGSSNSRYAW